MPKYLSALLFGASLAVTATLASACPASAVESAASSASSVAVRVEGAVVRGTKAAERGVKRAASAAEHGASVAGGAIERTARRLGLPASGASGASSPQ